MKKKLLIIFILLLLVCVLAITKVMTTRSYDQRFMDNDPTIQKAIIEKVSKLKIDHKVDKNRFLLFHSKDMYKIRPIIENTRKDLKQYPTFISIKDDNLKDAFLKSLERSGIVYSIDTLSDSDREVIRWKRSDAAKVEIIKKKLFGSLIKKKTVQEE